MNKNIIFVLAAIIFFALVGTIIHAALKPKPYIWYPSYYNIDKQPYGSWVLFSQLKHFFPGKKVKRLSDKDLEPYLTAIGFREVENENTYDDYNDDYSADSITYNDYQVDDFYVDSTEYDEYLNGEKEYFDEDDDSYYYEDSESYEEPTDTLFKVEFIDSIDVRAFNIFFIGESFEAPENKSKAILQHVHQGNHILIATQYVEPYLLDYLGLKMGSEELVHMDDPSTLREFEISLYGNDAIKFKPFQEVNYFEKFPETADVIATNGEGRTVGLTLSIGKGKLTFFSLPILMTNYYILKQDKSLAADLLKTLSVEDTYWAHYISDLPFYNYPEKRSILVFIHSQESLTWAFYVLLFSLLIFFIFQIKRKQKVIPVHAAPENTSVKFSNTLSNLYLNKKDNKDILHKKMNYFLMRVRDKYHIDTNTINEEFMKKLAIKSNVKLGVIKLLFYRYETFNKQNFLSAEDFLEVNKLFQDFKQQLDDE